jgi:hypothetical protein
MRAALALALCLFACAKPEPLPPSDPTAEAADAYYSTAERLKEFIDGSGFVVSRFNADGRPEHEGDSLIWSGVALASVPCAVAAPIASGLRDMVATLSGGVYRHPSLPQAISLDGAIGLYYGMADSMKRCGEDWGTAADSMEAFAEATGDHLNPSGEVKLYPEFTFARDAVLAMAGARGKPHGSRLASLETQVIAWAKAAKVAKASCFRIHVGWLSLRAAELAGYSVTPAGKSLFCGLTDGLGLPTIDHWCGREGLLAYLDAFEFDQWEYRHQRCSAWETPDGREGLKTPAIDRLAALRAQYGFAEAP